MPDQPNTPASKNPYNGQSYDKLLETCKGFAATVMKATESVAKCDKDPKTKRDVSPATDTAGQMLLALGAFKSEYARAIKAFGGSDEQIIIIKRKAGEARSALRLAIKLMAEVSTSLVEADEFLDLAADAYTKKHSDEMEAKALRLEQAAKKAQEEAAKIRSSKSGKRAKASA